MATVFEGINIYVLAQPHAVVANYKHSNPKSKALDRRIADVKIYSYKKGVMLSLSKQGERASARVLRQDDRPLCCTMSDTSDSE